MAPCFCPGLSKTFYQRQNNTVSLSPSLVDLLGKGESIRPQVHDMLQLIKSFYIFKEGPSRDGFLQKENRRDSIFIELG